MSTSTISPLASLAVADQTQNARSANADVLAEKEVFLQLLVAQIKNQDPLNPTDGVQFLSQLTQFSQLEQLIGLRQDLQVLTDQSEHAASTTENRTVQA